MTSKVQSILFDKTYWTPSLAKRWLASKGYRFSKIHTTSKFHRFRQVSPARLASKGYTRYRNTKIPGHIELVLAFKSGR